MPMQTPHNLNPGSIPFTNTEKMIIRFFGTILGFIIVFAIVGFIASVITFAFAGWNAFDDEDTRHIVLAITTGCASIGLYAGWQAANEIAAEGKDAE